MRIQDLPVGIRRVMNSSGAATDSTFLGKLNSASTGALILTATDAATSLNFTSGTLATPNNMSVGVNVLMKIVGEVRRGCLIRP